MNLSSSEIREVSAFTVIGEFTVQDIKINSQNVQLGDLFVALPGKQTDGSNFIFQALNQGAAAVMITKSYYDDLVKKGISSKVTNAIIINGETKKGLYYLALIARNKFKGKIIGITGSVGKTSLKSILNSSLNNTAFTHAVYSSFGNFNNDIGLPLSLAKLTNKSKVAIFELGMNATGEIKYLSRLLQPHIAIITEITNAHSNFFSSLEEIAEAKLEILSAPKPPDTFIMNYNNKFYNKAIEYAKTKGVKHTYSFGISGEEDFICQASQWVEKFRNVVSVINGKKLEYKIQALAEHQAVLATVALGVAEVLACNLSLAANGLLDYQIPKGRGNIEQYSLPNSRKKISFTLINDSYNANPLSMTKSIMSLSLVSGYNRKLMLLGDMFELDKKNELEYHLNLASSIVSVKPDHVFTIGHKMLHLAKHLKSLGVVAEGFLDPEEAFAKLVNYLQNNDILLAKGSLSSGVYLLIEKLIKFN